MASPSVDVQGYDENETNSIEVKKSQVTDRLQKRELERQTELCKRRERKEHFAVSQESVQFFTGNFSVERKSIEREVELCGSLVDRSQLVSQFDKISISFSKLQKYLADSTIFLSSFEIRQAQEQLNKLQNEISENRERLLPKKRFAFRLKKKSSSRTGDADSGPTTGVADNSDVELPDCNFSKRTGETLCKYAEETNKRDVALSHLTACTVRIYGSPSAVHADRLKDCKVFIGPVSSSVFIRNSVGCIFVLACHQLRIHNSTNSHFYIHVKSRAIIEDCSGIKFASYNWKYPKQDEHFLISNLDPSRNNWSDIDDFNWLVSDTHSPNWSLLNEDEIISSWNI